MSAVLLIFEGGEVDKFAHGTSVPCRAEDIFDHSFRSQSKGNLLDSQSAVTKKDRLVLIGKE